MSEHALCSPSSAHRWTECTASPAEEARHPDTSGEAARRGTFLHSIAERVLRADDGGRAVDLVGTVDPSGEFTLDAEMASGVDVFIDAVRFTCETSPGVPELRIEARVTYDRRMWGTADALVVHRHPTDHHLLRVDVLDLKGGQGVYVEADANLQLACYLIAALRGLPVPAEDDPVVTFGLHIVQPLHHQGGAKWRVWSPSTAEMIALRNRIQKALDAVEKTPEFLAGEHCRWCRASATCAARREYQLELAAEAFSDTPVEPSTLSPDALADLLLRFDDLRSWMRDIEAHAERLALAGTPIPHHKLVHRIGNRAWRDDTVAESTLSAFGVDPHNQSLITPAEAERRLKAAGLKPKDTVAAITPLVHRPVTGTVLVPDTDSRPSIEGPDFTNTPTPEISDTF